MPTNTIIGIIVAVAIIAAFFYRDKIKSLMQGNNKGEKSQTKEETSEDQDEEEPDVDE